MKKSPYSPDEFMSGLYDRLKAEPYKNADSYKDALEIGKSIKEKAKKLFALEKLDSMSTELKLIPIGKELDYPEYTLKKYSVEILQGLNSLIYILEPKNVKGKTGGVVALCGHGYGVRQILNISKKGNKKHFNYIDNYQNNFAVEMAKRGCTVITPELFGFGEARLQHDLCKPFYISSCDELSHHLLPYGLTTASLRVYQALACAKILRNLEAVDESKISLMGISGGGLTALYASVLDDSIYKTVICGYVNTFKDSILSMWHCPDNYIPHILEVGEIYDFASALAPKELFIESGEKDKLFPIKASEKAHSKIKRVYSLMNAEDKLHIDIFPGKHAVCGRKSFDWLAK
ncbi:MAG: alpha/beta hydrolase family protein [Acutalibacteraceae bacterium]|nr:alpha/beta hydrolase family protein [Acutalibacteraceae bacterium]